MKRKLFAGALLLALGVSSCIKHEIIPPPRPKVDLSCHFQGNINGDIELTQNVNGYFLDASKTYIIVGSDGRATYYANMLSAENLLAVQVTLGSVLWNAQASQDPSLSTFNSFVDNNLTPSYSANAVSGFEVTYKDPGGIVWKSKEADPPQSVEFKNISHESDDTGDYSKFICEFSCNVYHQFLDGETNPFTGEEFLADTELSIPIQDAVFKGWFKR